MPKFIKPTLLILAVLALVPPVLVARARVATTTKPRLHIFLDMDQQQRFKAQQRNPAFADGRAMRPGVPGTVARGELEEDDHLYRGQVDGKWAEKLPMPITKELLLRGQERYAIFCATCHGLSGGGNGPTSEKAMELQEGTWTPPSSFHTDLVRKRAVGHLYNSIKNGIRNMPAYGPQISPEDRWAIVAYVRALIRSQRARIEDVPKEYRERLR
ncbi:MAG: c-type cytochrome [Planctomycetota bacterium]